MSSVCIIVTRATTGAGSIPIAATTATTSAANDEDTDRVEATEDVVADPSVRIRGQSIERRRVIGVRGRRAGCEDHLTHLIDR